MSSVNASIISDKRIIERRLEKSKGDKSNKSYKSDKKVNSPAPTMAPTDQPTEDTDAPTSAPTPDITTEETIGETNEPTYFPTETSPPTDCSELSIRGGVIVDIIIY